MAALTASGVTLNGYYYVGIRPTSKRKIVGATLVLSSQGGLTNNIPAALFGLTSITKVHACRDASSNLFLCGPSWDGTIVGAYLVFYALTSATDATRNAPADISATVRVTIEGIE